MEPAFQTQSLGRLLIVDDDQGVVAMMVDSFADQGVEVTVAYDGEQAIRSAEHAPPDVVLLDITMPGKDGVEVLRELRARWPTLRVIMVSGNGDEDLARATLKLGAFDYVAKPFAWSRLQESVFAALAQA